MLSFSYHFKFRKEIEFYVEEKIQEQKKPKKKGKVNPNITEIEIYKSDACLRVRNEHAVQMNLDPSKKMIYADLNLVAVSKFKKFSITK